MVVVKSQKVGKTVEITHIKIELKLSHAQASHDLRSNSFSTWMVKENKLRAQQGIQKKDETI
jgi:hypothetical protein